MHRNMDEGFEIEIGVGASELKGAATVEALTITVMMSIFSDIYTIGLSAISAIIVPCYCTTMSPNYCANLQLIHDAYRYTSTHIQIITLSLNSSISKRLPFAHVREMHCNKDESFEIEFGMSAYACELRHSNCWGSDNSCYDECFQWYTIGLSAKSAIIVPMVLYHVEPKLLCNPAADSWWYHRFQQYSSAKQNQESILRHKHLWVI